MLKKIKNKNKKSGAFFLALSILFLSHGRNYPIGDLARIEFGFFPVVAGIGCLALSIILFFLKDYDR